MKRIYEAANNVEAHMIVHMLEQAGIEAHVQGEHLQSGVGELPMGGLVAVAVADQHADDARRHIKEWEERTRSAPEQTKTRAEQRTFYGHLIAFVVGGLIGAGIIWSIHHGPDTTDGIDWNGDGKRDEHAYFDGETVDRVEHDRNFDGKIDAIEYYDLNGLIARFESDDDFDGRRESILTYDGRWAVEFVTDEDGDDRHDYRVTYKYGIPRTAEYFDRSGRVVKRVHSVGTRPDTAELDLDGDGTFERSYRFDRYDEPTDIETSN